jgi:hypothetical protein
MRSAQSRVASSRLSRAYASRSVGEARRRSRNTRCRRTSGSPLAHEWTWTSRSGCGTSDAPARRRRQSCAPATRDTCPRCGRDAPRQLRTGSGFRGRGVCAHTSARLRVAVERRMQRQQALAPRQASDGLLQRYTRDRHPRPLPPRDARLHRAAPSGRQDHPRSHPLPQALPRPPRLATPPTAPPRPRNTAITINFLT